MYGVNIFDSSGVTEGLIELNDKLTLRKDKKYFILGLDKASKYRSIFLGIELETMDSEPLHLDGTVFFKLIKLNARYDDVVK